MSHVHYKSLAGKIILYVAFFALIIGSGLFVLKLLVDPERWRPDVEAYLKDHIQAHVTLGKLELSVARGLGLDISGILIEKEGSRILEIPLVSLKLSPFSIFRLKPSWKILLLKPQLIFEKQYHGNELLTFPQESTLKPGIISYFLGSSVFDIRIKEGSIRYQHDLFKKPLELKKIELALNGISYRFSSINYNFETFINAFETEELQTKGRFISEGTISFLEKEPLKFKFLSRNDFSFLNIQYGKHFNKPEQVLSSLSTDIVYAIKNKTYSGKFFAELLNLKMNGDVSQESLSLKTTQFNIQDYYSYFPILKDQAVSGLIQLDLKFFDTGWKKRRVSFEAEHVDFKFPLLLENISIKNLISFDGTSSFLFSDDKLSQWSAHGIFDLTKGDIAFLGDNNQKVLFQKGDKIPFLIKTNHSYESQKGFEFESLNIDLDQFNFSLLGKGAYKNKLENNIKIQTSHLNLEILKKYFPIVRDMGFYGGQIDPVQCAISNGEISSEINIQNIQGEPHKLSFLPQTFVTQGKFKANGKLKFTLSSLVNLSHVSGALQLNLTECDIVYKDLLNKKNNMPLESSAQFSYDKDKGLEGNIFLKLPDLEVSGVGELKNEDVKFTLNTSQASLATLKEIMPSLSKYGLSRGEVSGKLDLQGKVSQPHINATANLKRVTGYFKESRELFPGLLISGGYNLNADFQLESVQEKVRLQKLNGYLSLTDSKIKYSDYFNKAPGQNLYLQVETKPSEEGVAIEKAELKLLDIPFNIQGEIKDLKSPIFDFKTEASVSDLSQLASVIVMLKKFDARGKASLKGQIKKTKDSSHIEFEQSAHFENAGLKFEGLKSRFENIQGTAVFKNDSVTLKKISFNSGSSQFDVYGTLKNFDSPQGNLSITASYLDLNEFFEKPKARVSSTEEIEGVPAEKEKTRSVANIIEENPFLKNMNMVGKVFVKNGKVSTYDYSDLNASISFQDRIFKLGDMDVKMYGGKVGARFNVNYKGDVPEYEFEGAVADLNLEQFLGVRNQQLAQEVQGSFSTHCVMRGKGLSWEQFRSNAVGSGKLIVKNGKFSELNIIASVMGTLKIFQSRVPDGVDLSGNFNSVTGNFEMERGRVSTENLYLDAKDYYITLNGEFFMDKRIKYKGKYLFKKEGYGFPIFVDISGTISQPQVHPDVQEYVKSILTGAITDIFN